MERSDALAPAREWRIASGMQVADQAPLRRALRSVALLLSVLLAIVMGPAAASPGTDLGGAQPAAGFTLLRSSSHVEISGGPEHVPAIVDAMESLANADGSRDLPVIVFINWRG